MPSKSIKKIKKVNKPRVRKAQSFIKPRDKQTKTYPKIYATSRRMLYKKLSILLKQPEVNIKAKMDKYLTAVNSGNYSEHQLNEWWNCNSCGYDKVSVCLFGSCCGGSADGHGNWEVSCNRKLGKPKEDMIQ